MKLRPIGAATAVLVAAVTTIALVGPAAAQGEVLVTNLDAKGWEFKSETNTEGHVEFVLNGVQLKTDNANGRAAGFKAIDGATLEDVAGAAKEPSLLFKTQDGATAVPAFQLELSSPSKGYLRLVGEPAYNGRWWASSSCTSCAAIPSVKSTSGDGGPFAADLDTWAKAFPDAKVTKIGFKLGLPGKGVLSQARFLGTTYRFAVAKAEEPTTTPEPTTEPEPTDEPDPTTEPEPTTEPTDDNNGTDNSGSDNGSVDDGSVDDGLNPGPITTDNGETVYVPSGGVETGGGPA